MTNSTFKLGFLSELESLAGRNALILGGHGELAHAMAAALADRGANVALAARKKSKCSELADDIAQAFGVKTLALGCNIAVEDEVQSAVTEVVTQLGSIDILINNAGTSWSGAPEDIPLSGWSKVIDVNLTGSFVAAREAARHMLKAGRGAIVFIASTGAFTSFTPEVSQLVPYTTSKAGLVHLTRDLAAQWAARGIRVNAVAPGQMNSGLTLSVPEENLELIRKGIPMGRFGDPVELAGAVAYLVSDAASYLTGQTIIIDGGQTLG